MNEQENPNTNEQSVEPVPTENGERNVSAFFSELAFVGMVIKSFLPKKKNDN